MCATRHAHVRLALFGATGGVGRHALRGALRAGHEVRALVRDPAKLGELATEVEVVVGDLARTSAIVETVAGAEGVLWTVGARSNTRDQPVLFENALATAFEALPDGARIVIISGAAVRLDADDDSLWRRLTIAVIRFLARYPLEANERQARVALATTKPWVLVRPGMMPERPERGAIRAAAARLPGLRTTKADVATFMLEQLTTDVWLGKAPFISS